MRTLEQILADIEARANSAESARTDIPRLLAALRKAVEQRNAWAQTANAFMDIEPNDSLLQQDDAELAAILAGDE